MSRAESGRLRRILLAACLTLILAAGIGCGSAAESQGAASQAAGNARGDDFKPAEKEEPSEHEASALPGQQEQKSITLADIPAYEGEAYTVINNNMPCFTKSDCSAEPFEHYSDFDALGRCGAAFANICPETMPTKERGPIGQVRPSGWHTVKYDSVDGKYLYNRCHLIGYQLAAENANEQNLITGTRYLNTEGMLPFENKVADYVKETGGHVLYRVTPMFEGDHLVADGVLMEAWSVEDDGAGVCFNVFVYNVQPGIGIDYATGESWQEDGSITLAGRRKTDDEDARTYILNTNTMKFHDPTCRSVRQMSDENRQEYSGTREELIEKGYDPCGQCHP